MNFFKLFLVFFVSVTLYANNQQMDKISLQLQWKHQFEFAGFYAAKEMGFYSDVGLDVEFREYNKTINITDEVLSGRVEYGLSYSSIIADYIDGKPIVLVANFFKQSPLVLIAQKDIKTPKELKGKKVMGVSNSIDNITLLLMLEKFGVKTEDVINIETTFNVDNFINKKVDAMSVFTTNELYILNQKGIEYNIFDPVVYGAKYYDVNLFTSSLEALQNPKRVEDFRDASIRGWKYALKNKSKIIEIILKKYNTQNKTREALEFEAQQIQQIMLPNVYEIGSIDINRLKIIRDNFIQSGFAQDTKNKDIENLLFKEVVNFFNISIHKIDLDLYIKFLGVLIIFILFVVFLLIVLYKQFLAQKLNIKLERIVEEELQKSRDKDKMLFHQNKLASMGEMLENIAHQWRQPLSQINSTVLLIDDILEEKKIKDDELEEKLLEIEFLTKYLSNTINDFKDFFELNKLKITFSLFKMIEKSLYILKGTLKENNIDVHLECDEEYEYNGYENELQQVLVVILNNAKDSLQNSTILEKKIKINVDIKESFYLIKLCDNAGAMNNEIIDKVFEPYFTTKHKSQGTGLGLYMSKKIIQESFNGELNIHNSHDGVCFEIKFKVN